MYYIWIYPAKLTSNTIASSTSRVKEMSTSVCPRRGAAEDVKGSGPLNLRRAKVAADPRHPVPLGPPRTGARPRGGVRGRYPARFRKAGPRDGPQETAGTRSVAGRCASFIRRTKAGGLRPVRSRRRRRFRHTGERKSAAPQLRPIKGPTRPEPRRPPALRQRDHLPKAITREHPLCGPELRPGRAAFRITRRRAADPGGAR